MKVKNLIEWLSQLDPETEVVGFCPDCKNDFRIRGITTDVVATCGSDDGFHTEHGLSRFPSCKVSVCDIMPVGETVAVIH